MHNYDEANAPTPQDAARAREQAHYDRRRGCCLGAGCCEWCGWPIEKCDCDTEKEMEMLEQFVWFENSEVGINMDKVVKFKLKGTPRYLLLIGDEGDESITDETDIDNFMRNVARIGRRRGGGLVPV